MKHTLFFTLSMGLLVLSFTACKNNTTPKTVTVSTAVKTVEVTFKEAQPMSMDIEGMVCTMGCAAVIEKNLNQTAGIKEAKVDFETKKATLIYDADVLNPNEVTQVVLNTGEAYTVKSFELLD
ncbi:MAG: heavy-metal-associated domain-containing protein [Flavobacteriaceae bacterium]|jgi:mercuric ion binding protein|nr:heavy-metal-associated domain-containing protein [Flavobacteriaceae bacterium]